MTDDEPEPFFMSTGPEEDADATEVAGDGDQDLEALVEAARAAVEDAAATDDADRSSAAMWGDAEAETSPADDVWNDAATAAAADVWDLDDGDTDSVWSEAAAGAARATPQPAPDPEPAPTPPARPAAAEGMDHLDEEEEPEAFAFPLQDDAPTPPAAPASTDDEPETFTFAAGQAAPAPVPTPTVADEEEPEAFTFPVSDDAPTEPGPSPLAEASPSSRTSPFTDATPVADAWAADGDEADDDDDVWTSPMAHDDSAPLAEAARPRDDSGWRDLEAAQEPRWEVPDLPPQLAHDDEVEPAAFMVDIDSVARADEDHADVAEALGDLLDDEPTPATSPGSAADEPGALADLDLDHLDDMVAAVESAEAPPARADDEPHDEDAVDGDGTPLDAPTAARQVMEPGQVTFSSSRRKRRGLFG